MQAQDTKLMDRPQPPVTSLSNGAAPSTPAMAALQREQLTTYAGVRPLAEAVGNSMRPANVLEAMLCDELAAAHNASMRLLAKASVAEGIEPMVKLTLAAARMMASYQEGLAVLNRIRRGGEQATVVQNVSIQGGKAIVAANLKSGGVDGR